MKEIFDVVYVTGRGTIVVLNGYDKEAELDKTLWLYDEDRNLICKTTIRGIESQGNIQMAFKVRDKVENISGAKYYTL